MKKTKNTNHTPIGLRLKTKLSMNSFSSLFSSVFWTPVKRFKRRFQNISRCLKENLWPWQIHNSFSQIHSAYATSELDNNEKQKNVNKRYPKLVNLAWTSTILASLVLNLSPIRHPKFQEGGASSGMKAYCITFIF